MSDLISRSAVIDIIHKEIQRTGDFLQHDTQINIEFAVNELPTAFDTKKVLKQIADKREYYYLNDDVYDGIAVEALDEVVGIIEKGGIE